MSWLVLICSGVFESVWAISLGKSDGFTHPLPTAVFFIAMIISMLGLAYASKSLPMGTAYAVWTGVGASLTVIYGIVTGEESASPIRVLLLAGLIGCIIGLKLVSDTAN